MLHDVVSPILLRGKDCHSVHWRTAFCLLNIYASVYPLSDNKNLTFAFAGILSLDDLRIDSDSSVLTLNSDIRLKLTITSHLLAEVKMRKVIVPCEKLEEVSANLLLLLSSIR